MDPDPFMTPNFRPHIAPPVDVSSGHLGDQKTEADLEAELEEDSFSLSFLLAKRQYKRSGKTEGAGMSNPGEGKSDGGRKLVSLMPATAQTSSTALPVRPWNTSNAPGNPILSNKSQIIDQRDSPIGPTSRDRERNVLAVSSQNPLPSTSTTSESSQLFSTAWALCKMLAVSASVSRPCHTAEDFIWPLPIQTLLDSKLGNTKDIIESAWKCCFVVCENSSSLDGLYPIVERRLLTLCKAMMEHVAHTEADQRRLEAENDSFNSAEDQDETRARSLPPEGKLLVQTSFALQMCWELFFEHAKQAGTYASVLSMFNFTDKLFQLREIRYSLIMKHLGDTANIQIVIAELFLEAVWNLFSKTLQLTLLHGERERYYDELLFDEEIFDNCWDVCEVLKIIRKTKTDVNARNQMPLDRLLSRRTAAKRHARATIHPQLEKSQPRHNVDDGHSLNISNELPFNSNFSLHCKQRAATVAAQVEARSDKPSGGRTVIDEPVAISEQPQEESLMDMLEDGDEGNAPAPSDRTVFTESGLESTAEESAAALASPHDSGNAEESGDDVEESHKDNDVEPKIDHFASETRQATATPLGGNRGGIAPAAPSYLSWAEAASFQPALPLLPNMTSHQQPPTAPRSMLEQKPQSGSRVSPAPSVAFTSSNSVFNHNSHYVDPADIECLHHIRLRLLLLKTAQLHGFNKSSNRITFPDFVRDMPRNSFGRSERRQKLFSDFRNAVLDPGSNIKAKGDAAASEATIAQLHKAVEWKLSTGRHKFLKELFGYVTGVELEEVGRLGEDGKQRIIAA